MSLLTKLIFRPHRFFADAKLKKSALEMNITPGQLRTFNAALSQANEQALEFKKNGKPTAVLIGFSKWKTFMVDFLSEYNVHFLGHSPNVSEEMIESINRFPLPTVFAWSYRWPDGLRAYCSKHGINLIFVEDGFIRSVGLGIQKTKPLSLAFDKMAMHFDRLHESELERLLATYDFDGDPALMNQAGELAALVSSMQISKYNSLSFEGGLEKYVDQSKPERILVIGQVEDDMSIAFGMPEFMTCNDLVIKAAFENPNAQIFYRPHPEVLVTDKENYSKPKDVSEICHILPRTATLHECFAISTKVYAMTSLAGFEALLFGLPVKTFGVPFYAGWGLTEDVVSISRRTRRLTVLQVLAAAYIIYPRYYDPITNNRIGGLDAVKKMSTIKGHMASVMKIKQQARSDVSSVNTESFALRAIREIVSAVLQEADSTTAVTKNAPKQAKLRNPAAPQPPRTRRKS